MLKKKQKQQNILHKFGGGNKLLSSIPALSVSFYVTPVTRVSVPLAS